MLLPVAPVDDEASLPRHASMPNGLLLPVHSHRCRLMLSQAHSLPMPILCTTRISPLASGSSNSYCRLQWHPRPAVEHRRRARRHITRTMITFHLLAKHYLRMRLWEVPCTRLKLDTSASSLKPCSGAQAKLNG
jgi:hypothetical protein